jgi:hypothetical protein
VDRHSHPEPRMPMINQFSENGPVGVLKPSCTTATDLTRALSSLLHPAAHPHGSLTTADAPLIEAEKPFRQPGPPHPVIQVATALRFMINNCCMLFTLAIVECQAALTQIDHERVACDCRPFDENATP